MMMTTAIWGLPTLDTEPVHAPVSRDILSLSFVGSRSRSRAASRRRGAPPEARREAPSHAPSSAGIEENDEEIASERPDVGDEIVVGRFGKRERSAEGSELGEVDDGREVNDEAVESAAPAASGVSETKQRRFKKRNKNTGAQRRAELQQPTPAAD